MPRKQEQGSSTPFFPPCPIFGDTKPYRLSNARSTGFVSQRIYLHCPCIRLDDRLPRLSNINQPARSTATASRAAPTSVSACRFNTNQTARFSFYCNTTITTLLQHRPEFVALRRTLKTLLVDNIETSARPTVGNSSDIQARRILLCLYTTLLLTQYCLSYKHHPLHGRMLISPRFRRFFFQLR